MAEVKLREYVEAVLIEKDRATMLAEREREKATVALREAQQRASEKAERERERAANVLAEGLRLAIHEGDLRLQEHITQQIATLASAQTSAGELELERFERAKAEVDALRREMQLVSDAQQSAVSKAEEAQKEVNIRSNEFRGQLKDQNATMMPRLEAEALFKELRLVINKVDDKTIANSTRVEQWNAIQLQQREQIIDQNTGKQLTLTGVGLIVAVAAIIVTIAIFIATHI